MRKWKEQEKKEEVTTRRMVECRFEDWEGCVERRGERVRRQEGMYGGWVNSKGVDGNNGTHNEG